MTHERRRSGRALTLRTSLLIAALAVVVPAAPATAAAMLTITPLTWNVIGLDSNDVATGPDTFYVAARACNLGDTTATGVTSTLVWDSANPLVDVAGPATLTAPDIPPGGCTDLYHTVQVTRDPAAYDTTRQFHIAVTADNGVSASTPQPRELFVEQLISQARNDAIEFTGPTTVYVGDTVTYRTVSSTATNGYEQLESAAAFPPDLFRVVAVHQTYTAPPGATNDAVYADACGWDHDPSSPTYRQCVGPGGYAGGRAGGGVTTTYTLEVIAAGSADVAELIYDFSGSSYHYNSDFGAPGLTITALRPIDLALTKTVDPAVVAVGDELTYTITLTNDSPTAATGVVVSDEFPSEVTVIDSSTTSGTVDVASGTWTVGALAGGASTTLTVVGRADSAGTVTNSAEVVAADQPDLDSVPDNQEPGEDDLATATASVLFPELGLTKSVLPSGPVTVGDVLTYTLVVTNTGQVVARAVEVVDPTPAGASYVLGSATVDGVAIPDAVAGDANPVAAGLDLGDLTAGQSRLLTYRLVAGVAGTEVTNTAAVTATSVPPVIATTSTVVAPPAATDPPPDPTAPDPAAPDPAEPGPPEPTVQEETLPRTGPPDQPADVTLLAVLALLMGVALLRSAYGIDKADRLRAIALRRATIAALPAWVLCAPRPRDEG